MRVMSQSKNHFELAQLGKFCYELQDINKAYKITSNINSGFSHSPSYSVMVVANNKSSTCEMYG